MELYPTEHLFLRAESMAGSRLERRTPEKVDSLSRFLLNPVE